MKLNKTSLELVKNNLIILIILLVIRLPAQVTYAEEFGGDASPQTTTHSSVRKNGSTETTYKLPTELKPCRKYIIFSEENLIILGDGKPQVVNTNYSCTDGRKINVRYLNKGANNLAIIPVEEENQILIFTGRVSASGAL
ncbi:palindromic element RPE1 domain-containing protein [Candidatus Tisiphia endosymbiont of Hybos culiciformis]|uniref:palindromic element RPE1 domain-containing protein n=1 Tax=Candidatus Tisiphia endosymbiont of Hybos culiciformis TaxID=3139331 RepID=UPI003CCB5CD4